MRKQNKAKNKQSLATVSNSKAKEPAPATVDSDSEEGTFSGWLRSGDGVELMKLFVICNSLIVFLTMTWPRLQETFNTVYYLITGDDFY